MTFLLVLASTGVDAQIPIVDIIGTLAKKVVMAIDLHVQQLQTEAIALQDAEKQLENAMELDKLNAITDWVQRQRDLYAEYYSELWQIKGVISDYERVKQLIGEEAAMVVLYKRMTAALGQDKHFTAEEVAAMGTVLNGMLVESVNAVGELTLVIQSFVTEMVDADRLGLIDETGDRIDKDYTDMQHYYERNVLLSLERARDAGDVAAVRALYGLE